MTDQSALKLETPDQGPVLRPAVHVLLWANHAPQRLLRYLWSAGIVIGGTLVAEGLYRAFDLTRLSMVFLATVLLAALHLGRGPALFAAVFAFVIYNFYLVEPRFSFQFASADDFLTLLLFLAVAVGTGNLAGRVRDEVVQRRARERTLSTLFDASRLMSATESVEILRPRIAEAVATAAQACAIVVDEDGSQHSAGIVDGPAEARQLAAELSEEVVAYQEVRTLRAGIWRARPLYADGRPLGAVVWRVSDDRVRRDADTESLINVLVDMGAAAIARASLSSVKAEMEAVTRAEHLRTALLSSISHDFRTPLSAILASATSLLEYDDRLEPEIRKDLLLNIQEEVERLNRFVANLLNMTKLESGVLEVRTEPVPVGEVIDRVLRRLGRRPGGRSLVQTVDDRSLEAEADPVLLEQALTNIAENAVQYSPDGSTVTVRAQAIGGRVRIDVLDEGEGVPARDRHRIFEKFFRAANARSAPQGAGLGLSIARGLIEAMGGEVSAETREDGRSGLRMQIQLAAATT